eukprot:CAMPEP_0119327532 /NCGR_PEP_ID=MMETSP1333-20130426/71020_1 /TAXON_ID=418940 /ORGANISM="Scyphosphaera apsteinii, Strain RCC1455" /LENGTH=188 /DNA_ID=CAMNT_0007336151 /DNA_START=121 /DNA_END=687 /DNA_ORIENTATION=+
MIISLLAIALATRCEAVRKCAKYPSNKKVTGQASRRSAVGFAAAAAAAVSTPAFSWFNPLDAKPKTLNDVVADLDRSSAGNDAYWAASPPLVNGREVGIASQIGLGDFAGVMEITFTARPEDDVSYMWFKKYTPNAAPGYVAIMTASRIKPETLPSVTKLLPVGTYVPMLFSESHGVWTGKPFKIGQD